MGNDRISIMHRVTMETLDDIKSNMQSVTPEEVRNQIMENVRGAVKLENVNREKGEKIRLARNLITTTSRMGIKHITSNLLNRNN